MKTVFTEHGWADYVYWSETDRRMTKRINRLIEDSKRDPFAGIGKPEPLKGDLSGYWSRRIDEEHRLVYRARGNELIVVQARYHY
ncbi:toxin YoeB [Streptomyces abyssalis]|uniref:Endoribonuclease YoeB n=1 Tax=Streptomyces abyssalis TaxID=933944 RepID=A0A1E7JKP5_9ACTN|nr:Txe/YoeB family addiction module toxin [Streptomyces abyssalis]OEU88224.1 toxin YoeB [Streptomyces abyssalis]OEU91095.1 toxin YoeB [Streptomyces abyssalis]OEV05496.1 toxin YoeB [Streptomyces nanshensis]